jgi:hypothetical protein
MTFALPIQALLAQIAVAAFENSGEESKFVFFAQSHRQGLWVVVKRGRKQPRGALSTAKLRWANVKRHVERATLEI